MSDPLKWEDQTAQGLAAAGWSCWDGQHWLCPPDVLASMPDGTVLQAIDGDLGVVGRDQMDNATRFGVTAWGVVVGASTPTPPTALEYATRQAAQRSALRQTLAMGVDVLVDTCTGTATRDRAEIAAHFLGGDDGQA